MIADMNEQRLQEEMGKRLRAERERQGLTQQRVADMAGLDRSYYVGVEAGKRNVTFRTFCRMAHALGQDVAYFLKDMPTPAFLDNDSSEDIGDGKLP